jgi:hypothetical protein
MGILKKYVHNHARPEESIAKGYGIEEVMSSALILFLTLTQLVFLNRDTRGD